MADDILPQPDPIVIDPIAIDPVIDPLITPEQQKDLDAKEMLLRDTMTASAIPDIVHNEVSDFILRGIKPVDTFVQAVFANDLYMAFRNADGIKELVLAQWFEFITAHTPGECQGSAEKFFAWSGLYEIARQETAANIAAK